MRLLNVLGAPLQGVWGKGRIIILAASLFVGTVALGQSSQAASVTSNTNSATNNLNGVSVAAAQLAKYMGKTTKFRVPGPSFDAKKAAGKTVWFIPNDYSYPIYRTIVGAMKLALGKVDVHLTVCDGQGNPTQQTACVNEAVAQKAGAIIFDSIYPNILTAGIKKANAAHIPVIMGNDQSPGGPLPHGISAQVAFQYTLSARLVADWIIVNSTGHANVMLTDTTDSPNGASIVTDGYLYQLRHLAPASKEYIYKLSVTQWATELPSMTTSALTEHPQINYVVPEYDLMTPYMGPAIEQLGKQSVVKIATFNADLEQMQQLAKHQLVYVDVGSDNPYEGWAYADQALRLMTGNRPVANEYIPVRVFTRQNVRGLMLTAAGENSGIWYGSAAAYENMYLKLWGIK